ncbi:MAG: hypothetical protein DDG60_06895 [Anaerolineae bacterium]|nr:MAG: hypothetical protein DDG60_06895 [Anaerolineae bacterium]
MNDFFPPRQRGLVIHLALIAFLSLLSGSCFWLVFRTPVGLEFTLYIVGFLVTVLPLPVLAYRLYALNRAHYHLDRNTLRLAWGLRLEEIPVSDIEWIRPMQGLVTPLSLPFFRLPGGILGITRHPEIGEVEFLASETDPLLLVATPRRVYAISPADPAAFVAAFQKIIEMGSLTTGTPRSEFPSFVVGQAWNNWFARTMWLTGLFANLVALVWVGFLIPSGRRAPLGFGPGGTPLEAVPAAQLILLPFLSLVLFSIGWLAGIFFYRRTDQQVHSLTLWASGALTSLLFLLALYFLINTPL